MGTRKSSRRRPGMGVTQARQGPAARHPHAAARPRHPQGAPDAPAPRGPLWIQTVSLLGSSFVTAPRPGDKQEPPRAEAAPAPGAGPQGCPGPAGVVAGVVAGVMAGSWPGSRALRLSGPGGLPRRRRSGGGSRHGVLWARRPRAAPLPARDRGAARRGLQERPRCPEPRAGGPPAPHFLSVRRRVAGVWPRSGRSPGRVAA